ncbi:putative TetR-family transcriptional regulator [Streptomyces sp. Tu6071]|nr:putative TetR-family transcriptional regulator [Streptomyces sp. Tu6071]
MRARRLSWDAAHRDDTTARAPGTEEAGHTRGAAGRGPAAGHGARTGRGAGRGHRRGRRGLATHLQQLLHQSRAGDRLRRHRRPGGADRGGARGPARGRAPGRRRHRGGGRAVRAHRRAGRAGAAPDHHPHPLARGVPRQHHRHRTPAHDGARRTPGGLRRAHGPRSLGERGGGGAHRAGGLARTVRGRGGRRKRRRWARRALRLAARPAPRGTGSARARLRRRRAGHPAVTDEPTADQTETRTGVFSMRSGHGGAFDRAVSGVSKHVLRSPGQNPDAPPRANAGQETGEGGAGELDDRAVVGALAVADRHDGLPHGHLHAVPAVAAAAARLDPRPAHTRRPPG